MILTIDITFFAEVSMPPEFPFAAGEQVVVAFADDCGIAYRCQSGSPGVVVDYRDLPPFEQALRGELGKDPTWITIKFNSGQTETLLTEHVRPMTDS